MAGLRQFAIALRWALCLSLTPLFGQGRDDYSLPQLSKQEADKVLADLRNSRLGSDVCFRFEAIHRPRKGEDSPAVKGTLWAASRGDTHLLRIEMQDAAGTRIIARKSPAGAEISVHAGGKVTKVAPGSFHPVSSGLLLSAFDLQLPFTHWSDTRYVSTERGRRPMHVYQARHEGLAGSVEFGVDRAYGVILEVATKSAEGDTVRTLAAEEFAKAGEQWVLGVCSLRDQKTRDSDLLTFTEAALGLRLDEAHFREDSLARPAAAPDSFRPL